MLSSDAHAIRDGKEIMIGAEQLVPGELCLLELVKRFLLIFVWLWCPTYHSGEAGLTGEAAPINTEIFAIALKEVTDPEQVPLGDHNEHGLQCKPRHSPKQPENLVALLAVPF